MILRDTLIFDFGMHKGEDTAYYLARGYTVVGVEADPELLRYCEKRFSGYLDQGRLILIGGAIAEHNDTEVTFYKDAQNSVWGTLVPSWASRNERYGATYEQIAVPTVNSLSLFEKYGVPHYLKVDIEGMDLVCLEQLTALPQKPNYLSVESTKRNFEALRVEFSVLKQLGYTKFKVVQQFDVPTTRVPSDSTQGTYVDYTFEYGSSGMFGEDLAGPWLDEAEALLRYEWVFKQYKLFGDDSRLRRNRFGNRLLETGQKLLKTALPGWFDTHAKLMP